MKSLLPRSFLNCSVGFRSFLAGLLMWMTCGFLSAATQRPPNVLFILVDDYGIKDVGIEGSTFYETPHIDAFARSAMRFTQGYAACAVCSPSRASILTGQYSARHGITDFIGAGAGESFAATRHTKLLVPNYVHNLPAHLTTLADALRQSGYRTFFAGKWHLGGKGAWPEDRGFEINKGGWEAGGPEGGYFAPWINPNLPSGPRGQNLDQRLADETISFIEKNADHPFLAYLAFYAVHGPIETSKPLWEKYREKAAKFPVPSERFTIDRTLPVRIVQDNPVYAGLIDNLDNAVGRVLSKIDELGLSTNTIVILTSDNGGVVSGDAYSSSQLPFRGGKGRQWEGGIRVPLYIRAPGLTKAGSLCETPVSGIDFLPTILDLTSPGVKPKQLVDGVSLLPLLKGENLASRPLFWHYPHYGNQGGEPSSIVREGDWKLIHYWEDGHDELYNLSSDIGERNDVAAKEPVRADSMRKDLESWLKETGAKIPKLNAKYQAAWTSEKEAKSSALKQKLEKEHAALLKPDWKPNPTWWKSQETKD